MNKQSYWEIRRADIEKRSYRNFSDLFMLGVKQLFSWLHKSGEKTPEKDDTMQRFADAMNKEFPGMDLKVVNMSRPKQTKE